jgi:sporulation protein YlmC with PRC-barrel domain
MRGADLQGKRVRSEDGRSLGRVVEVHVRDGEVSSIVYGTRGLLQRFMSSRRGSRVAWSAVVRVSPDALVIRLSRGAAGQG